MFAVPPSAFAPRAGRLVLRAGRVDLGAGRLRLGAGRVVLGAGRLGFIGLLVRRRGDSRETASREQLPWFASVGPSLPAWTGHVRRGRCCGPLIVNVASARSTGSRWLFGSCVTGSAFSIDSACQPLTSARIHMVVCDLVVAAQVEAVETERWTPSAGTVVVLAFRPVGEPPLF